MSDEGGDRIDSAEDLAVPDRRMRAGSRNKPTQKEREEHEATHVPFRDWCVNTTSQNKKMRIRREGHHRHGLLLYHNEVCCECLNNSEESVTSIAVKAKFIDLLSYREITLKSDTQFAIIAFRNRVAEMCKAKVTTEDAVKGDKKSRMGPSRTR